MEKFVLGIMVGIIIYVVVSIVIDAILLFTKSLNKKQSGTIGIILNMVFLIAVMQFREAVIEIVGSVWFWIAIICMIVNIILSCIQFAMGMISANPYE